MMARLYAHMPRSSVLYAGRYSPIYAIVCDDYGAYCWECLRTGWAPPTLLATARFLVWNRYRNFFGRNVMMV